MRLGSKRFVIGVGALLVATAMAVPSFAAKQAVSDDELDLVTAAGQPTIISGGAGSAITFAPSISIAQTIQGSSQFNLRALALNNVAGENQVANGINISGADNDGVGAQDNKIRQSWGSTNDLTVAKIGGLTAKVTVVCNASALICKPTTTSAVPPGAGITKRVLQTADHIINVGAGSTVTYNPTMRVDATLDTNSQSGLVALVVNNVAGLNQVGVGINIWSSNVTLPNATGDIAFINTGGVAPTIAGQRNDLGAWRGTPAGTLR